MRILKNLRLLAAVAVVAVMSRWRSGRARWKSTSRKVDARPDAGHHRRGRGNARSRAVRRLRAGHGPGRAYRARARGSGRSWQDRRGAIDARGGAADRSAHAGRADRRRRGGASRRRPGTGRAGTGRGGAGAGASTLRAAQDADEGRRDLARRARSGADGVQDRRRSGAGERVRRGEAEYELQLRAGAAEALERRRPHRRCRRPGGRCRAETAPGERRRSSRSASRCSRSATREAGDRRRIRCRPMRCECRRALRCRSNNGAATSRSRDASAASSRPAS